MIYLNRHSKKAFTLGAVILGLNVTSLSSGAVPMQSVTPSRVASTSSSSKDAGIVPIRVVARMGEADLVPELGNISTDGRNLDGRTVVLGLSVQGAPLSFDGLTSSRQADLVTRFGRDAGKRYEAGIALQLKDLVDSVHAKHPTCRVGVMGMPFSSGTDSAIRSNSNYSRLIGTIDVFMPRSGDIKSSQAIQELSRVARGREILPVANTSSNGRSGKARINVRQAGKGKPVSVGTSGDNSRSAGTDRSRRGSGRQTISITSNPDGLTTGSSSSEINVAQRLQGVLPDDAITALLGDWGSSDSQWDMNGDGIVNGFDLTIILGYYEENDDGDGSEGNDGDNDGGNEEDGGDGGGDPGGDTDGDGGSADGIQDLLPGPGFNGTTSQPGRVGSSSSPGYAAQSIARWTEFPFITRDRDFYVTISAFHMTDINRVEFTLDGGEPVVCTEVQAHPETGYAEYIVNIDVSALATGMHEIRAIAYPNHGIPRVLQGRTPEGTSIHEANNGNESFWFNYDPAPTTVHVGPNGQYDSVTQAINALGEDLYGGRIYLSAGEHVLFDDYNSSFRNTAEDKVLTISAAPGLDASDVFVEGYTQQGDGYLRFGSIHVRNVSILVPTTPNYYGAIKGSGSNRLFIEGVYNTSLDPVMGWGDLGVQRLAEPTSDWTRGCWVMGCEFVNIPMGIKSVMLAKNCNYTRISADAFGAGPGAAVNCWIDKGDPANANHEAHADIFQISVYQSVSAIENRIFADITSTNSSLQVGHISGENDIRNIAFVRWVVDSMYTSSTMNFYHDMDHVVMDGCTFRNCAVSWNADITHVLLRDTLMRKFVAGGQTFDDVFVASKTIVDNLHFMVQANPPLDWATVGDVYFAAPSAPLGEPSNGTGGYIPSYVMSDNLFTDQYIGNADCLKQGQINDHFYYDKNLLDLRWWP